MNLVQLLHVESSKVIAKLEKDLDNHLKKDHPNSLREKRLQIPQKRWKLTKELEKRLEKKWVKLKKKN